MLVYDYNLLLCLKHSISNIYIFIGNNTRLIESKFLIKDKFCLNYIYEYIHINNKDLIKKFNTSCNKDFFGDKKLLNLCFDKKMFFLYAKNKEFVKFINNHYSTNNKIFIFPNVSYNEFKKIKFLENFSYRKTIIYTPKLTTKNFFLLLQQRFNVIGYNINYYKLKQLANKYNYNLYDVVKFKKELFFLFEKTIDITVNDLLSIFSTHDSFSILDLIKYALNEKFIQVFNILKFFQKNVDQYSLFLFIFYKELNKLLKIKSFTYKKYNCKDEFLFYQLSLKNISLEHLEYMLINILYLDLCIKYNKLEQFWEGIYNIVNILMLKNNTLININYYDKFNYKFT